MGRLFARSDVLDNEWVIDVAVQMVIIRGTASNILALDAPASASSISRPARQAAISARQAIDSYVKGFDDLSLEWFETGESQTLDATAALDRMTRALLTFCTSTPRAYLYARAYADPVTHGYPASERLLPGMGGTGAGVGTGWERIRSVEPSTRH